MTGTLYLVATPIGNLSDISHRALETLETVDLIACEDTRHSRKLLNHYDIQKKLISYHEHNEVQRADEIARMLSEGRNVAVVSDAGTPGICDPSYRVVQKAYETGAKVVAIPGAAAFVSAAIVSALPTDTLFFGGFLPAKKGERINRLHEVKNIPATLVFYEAPHRLEKSLDDCAEILGDRTAVVVRELTKLHEEIVRGKLRELAETFSEKPVKGEIVLVIDRQGDEVEIEAENNRQSLSERVLEFEKDGLDNRSALKKAAKEFGISRSEAYRILVAEKKAKSV